MLIPTIPYSSASATRQVRPEVLRVEVGREAVGRVVRNRDRLGIGREPVDPRHRAERLLATHRHVHRDFGEHRGLEELAVDSPSADEKLGALGERVGDVPLDLRHGRLVDQRPDLGSLREAVGNLERADRLGERSDERVVDAVLDEKPVRRDTGLAGVPELAQDRAGHRIREIGVVEDDERRVAAELERDLLDLARALRHEQLAHLGRAREAELAHERVRRHLAADRRGILGVTGDDGEDAGRHACLLGERCDRERRQRGLLGGLQHHRAADRERRSRLSRRHRRREVPGSDARGDADRLAEDDDAPVGERLRDHASVEPLRLLGKPLVEGGGVADLGLCLEERLALLADEERREIVAALQHQVGEATQDLRPVLRGPMLPGRKRSVGGLDRPTRLGRTHPWYLGDNGAGRGVDDGEGRTRVGAHPRTVDVRLVTEEVCREGCHTRDDS